MGGAEGQVIYQEVVEGGSTRGPQALAVGADQTIYLLDSVPRRIYVIAANRVTRTIPLASAIYPLEILAPAGGLYVLDVDHRVLKLDYQGNLIREYRLPEGLKSEQVLRLVSGPAGNVLLWTVNYREFDLENLPAAVDLEAGVKEKDFRDSGITAPDGRRWFGQANGLTASILATKDRSAMVNIRANGTFGTARPVGFDRSGQPLMQVEDLYDDNGALGVEITIRRYNPAGQMTGVLRLPDEDFALPAKKHVELARDGSLYVMVPSRTSTDIYQASLGQGYSSKANRRMDLREEPAGAEPKSDAASPEIAPAPLSRLDARNRAYQMADYWWQWRSRYNYFLNCASRGSYSAPQQLTTVSDGNWIKGIPYTWGGFDSPWTRSDHQQWSNWGDALSRSTSCPGKDPGTYVAKGPLVGNVNTVVSWVSGSAGIDCSGFVAAASGNYNSSDGKPKPGTSDLADSTLTYDWKGANVGDYVSASVWRAQPMNFFVRTQKDAHTFFYLYGAPDATSIKTIESTMEGSPQGAKEYDRTWSYARGYQYHRSWWPRNYNNGGGDGPREPRTSGGYHNGSYAIRGQSVWYRFDVSSPSNVWLTYISRGDADLYVYQGDPWTYPSELNLVGRSVNGGTTNDVVWLPGPGTYYVQVYIFRVDSDGNPVYFNISW